MNSNFDIVYGVCVDNIDPNNAQRIRIFEMAYLDSIHRTQDEIYQIVLSNDNAGNYKPWGYSNGNMSTDPYLAEGFLPKQMNIVPEKNQLVKLIKYNGTPSRYEYVGPVTSDLIETRQNFLMGGQKTRPNNNDIKGIVPKSTKLPITGKNNEQILIGENTILERLNFITPQKTKRDKYPFIQFSQYPNTLNLNTRKQREHYQIKKGNETKL